MVSGPEKGGTCLPPKAYRLFRSSGRMTPNPKFEFGHILFSGCFAPRLLAFCFTVSCVSFWRRPWLVRRIGWVMPVKVAGAPGRQRRTVFMELICAVCPHALLHAACCNTCVFLGCLERCKPPKEASPNLKRTDLPEMRQIFVRKSWVATSYTQRFF